MSTTILETLHDALARHHAGDRREAEIMYRRILDEDPGNADAWNLMGMLLHQSGQHTVAASYLVNAVRLEPDIAQFHSNLGNVLMALGEPEKAVRCYEQAIRRDPQYYEAFTNLGNALQKLQCPGEAAAWYGRALERKPDCAQTWNCLGNALHALGQDQEAVRAFDNAIGITPSFAEAHMNLGNVYFNKAQYPLAELCYREAVRHAPRLAPALSNLAAALRPQRKLAEAENLCREALTLAPDYAEAYSNLAAVLIDCGQLDEAERYGREALRLKPDLPQAHVNAALLLMRRRRYAEAEAACRRALELKPDYAIAHNSLGWVLNETGRFQESADALHQALRLAPDMIDACCNLGCLHAEQLAYAEAFRWYEEALRRDSSCVTAHFGLALLYLAQGDFEKGWAEYEWRWRRPDVTPKNFQQPAWDGQPLAGKTILLYPEQGLGDTLHFARYVPMVEQAGGRVILECQPGLVEFFRENALGAGDIIPSGAPLPAFDLHAALLSLPRILGTRAGTIPGQTPYLHASPARAEAVRQRIAMYPGLKVGLSWAGNAKHASDHLRSLRLEQLRPLGDVSGVTFFNLQKGPQAGELAQSPDGLALIDLEEPHADIRHTAAIIAGLDLVITVDTLIAHLAGALGKPVWTLLPYNADWRWLLDREDTPWYPAMRLFRQPHWGAWEPVVEQVCRQLALFAQRER